jgi:nitrate reductase NapE component
VEKQMEVILFLVQSLQLAVAVAVWVLITQPMQTKVETLEALEVVLLAVLLLVLWQVALVLQDRAMLVVQI